MGNEEVAEPKQFLKEAGFTSPELVNPAILLCRGMLRRAVDWLLDGSCHNFIKKWQEEGPLVGMQLLMDRTKKISPGGLDCLYCAWRQWVTQSSRSPMVLNSLEVFPVKMVGRVEIWREILLNEYTLLVGGWYGTIQQPE